MKSIFITLLMFVVAIIAIHFKLFDLMSSSYFMSAALVLLIVALAFAYKTLGNPFVKDEKHDEKPN